MTNCRKDRLAVVARLLSAIKHHPEAAFTRQHQTANLNFVEAHKLIDGLLANGHVESFVYGSRTKYRITLKGCGFLSKIVDCYMLLDCVEAAYDVFVNDNVKLEDEIVNV